MHPTQKNTFIQLHSNLGKEIQNESASKLIHGPAKEKKGKKCLHIKWDAFFFFFALKEEKNLSHIYLLLQ